MPYNVNQYNTALYNQGGGFDITPSTDLVVFNGFSVSNNATLFVSNILDNMPERSILGGATPREDGEYFNADYWQRKVITISGWAKGADLCATEALLDTLRKELAPPEKFLDITKPACPVRRFTASLVNGETIFATRQGTDVTFVRWQAQFLCKTPFSTDRGFTTAAVTIVDTSPVNLSLCNEGTIEAEPIIIMIVDTAAPDITTINVKNTTNDDEMEITPAGGIGAGDVLILDSEEKTVKLNGTEIDYIGSFLTLDVATNLLAFTTTGTAFDYSTTVKWKRRYL